MGAATVAAGLGVAAGGRTKNFMSIEQGGCLKDHRLATKNIFKDLRKNVSRAGLIDTVTLINASSFDPATITRVKEQFGPGEIGLFIFDADVNFRRDMDSYRDRLADRCWVVIDDYVSPTVKGGSIRDSVDELVRAERLWPLGLYGWGTWIGRLVD
ncbi:MAG TPA: hypothetical protein VGH00_05570 [Chthoniobacterales bacterium]